MITSLQEVLRCLEDVLNTSWKGLEIILNMSWRRLDNTWKMCEDGFTRLLEDILKTSWRNLEDVWPTQLYWYWSRCLEDIFKTSSKDVQIGRIYSSWRLFEEIFKTSWRYLEEVWPRRLYLSWWRCLGDVLKTSPEDEDKRHLQDILIKTNTFILSFSLINISINWSFKSFAKKFWQFFIISCW